MEPTDALVDAASGEADARAQLDAKQLRKIAETGNHFLFLLGVTCALAPGTWRSTAL